MGDLPAGWKTSLLYSLAHFQDNNGRNTAEYLAENRSRQSAPTREIPTAVSDGIAACSGSRFLGL